MKTNRPKKDVAATDIARILGIPTKDVRVVLDPTVNIPTLGLHAMRTFHEQAKNPGNSASFMRRWNRLTNKFILSLIDHKGWRDIYSWCPPSRKKEVKKKWMDSLQLAIQKASTPQDMEHLVIDMALFCYSEPLDDQDETGKAVEAEFLSKWSRLTQEELDRNERNPEGLLRLMHVASPETKEAVEECLHKMIKMRIQPSRGVRGFFKKSTPEMQQFIIKCMAKKKRTSMTKSRLIPKP